MITARCRQRYAVREEWGDVPFEVAWPRVEDALVTVMLPKLREIMERKETEATDDTDN